MRLNPTHVHLLLALASGEKHGYALGAEVRERSGGGLKLGPGTLYFALERLTEAGLIEPAGNAEEPRGRQPYRLTANGRDRLASEVDGLRQIVELAEASGVGDDG